VKIAKLEKDRQFIPLFFTGRVGKMARPEDASR